MNHPLQLSQLAKIHQAELLKDAGKQQLAEKMSTKHTLPYRRVLTLALAFSVVAFFVGLWSGLI